MSLHDRYGLTKVINAAGTFTPLGVSRSTAKVRDSTGEALGHFFVMDELQDAASQAIARFSGAEAGTVVHCAAAGITLSVAAAMTGTRPEAIAALPDGRSLPHRVVMPAGHAVNYGHPILQAVRLAGAEPVLAGSEESCGIDDLEAALAESGTAGLLLVSSRLVRGKPVDLGAAAAAARRQGVPAIIDGAAQDLRIADLLATGAELIVVSAQKYLASPTAGLVIGRHALVEAVRAQEKGIGRAMKATKEAISGVLAAIEARDDLDLEAWRREQEEKLEVFLICAGRLPGVTVRAVADPAGMPFARAHLRIDERQTTRSARDLFETLKTGTPAIWVMAHGLADDEIILELVPLDEYEIDAILSRLHALLSASTQAP